MIRMITRGCEYSGFYNFFRYILSKYPVCEDQKLVDKLNIVKNALIELKEDFDEGKLHLIHDSHWFKNE